MLKQHQQPIRHQQPVEVMSMLWGSPEMLEELGKRQKDPTLKLKIGKVANLVALRLEQDNNGYETDESRQVKLLGAIPGWIRAERRLSNERRTMTKQERIAALQSVDVFNHIIRDMVDCEQYTRMSDIVRFVGGALLQMRAPEEVINFAQNSIRAIVDGMRHEIAAQSVISALPGVESVRGAESRVEESQGMDVIVEYQGREIYFDIKASERSASGAHSKHPYSVSMPVWSGFSREDFGDNLTLSNDALRAKGSYYLRMLNDAVFRQLAIDVSV